MFEDEIRRTLERLDSLDVPDAPLRDVTAAARRTRRRRAAGGVVALVLAFAGGGLGLRAITGAPTGDHPAHPPERPAPVGPPLSGWQQVGRVPLSHRNPGIVTDIAGRLVVLGGTIPQHCPKGSLCPTAQQATGGSVFDPATTAWTPIPPPPRALRRLVDNYSLWAVDGHRLVLLSGTFPARMVSYDIQRRRWRGYAPPPVKLHGNDFLAAGDGAAYVADQDDHEGDPESRLMRLDLDSGEWTELQTSPNTPLLRVRSAFVTPNGLLVAGMYDVDTSGRRYRAEVERYVDGQWRRYADPDVQAAGYEFHWTGGRLIAPFLFHTGHAAALDPRTGRWTKFAVQPPTGAQGWQVGSSEGAGFVMQDGLVFDLGTGRSRPLARPAGAAKTGCGAFVGEHLYVVDRRSRLWESTP